MKIECIHWRDCGVNGGGCCAAGKYSRPSFGVCLRICTEYDGPPRGLGDLVAKTTRAVGIRSCGGCKRRQRTLNKMFPA